MFDTVIIDSDGRKSVGFSLYSEKEQTMKFQPNPGRRQSVFPLSTRQSHEKQPVCALVYPFRQVSGRTTSGTEVRFPVSSPREVNVTGF